MNNIVLKFLVFIKKIKISKEVFFILIFISFSCLFDTNVVFAVDTTPPTVALTSAASSTVNASFTVTATFSEATTNFVLGDITVTNGTASNFSGSGTTYTFTVNPTLNGSVSVDIGAGVATDAAGNGNIATNLPPPTYALRSTGPGGGLVFYTTNGGLQGLEAATADQSTGIAWITGGSTQTTSNSGTSTAIGTGQSNTNAMIAQSGYTGGAAKVADDLVSGGKTDWFLPSQYELQKIYINLKSGTDENSATYTPVGSLSSVYYWSSSQYDSGGAWDWYFGGGSGIDVKGTSRYVRAVRAFTSTSATLTRTYTSPAPTNQDTVFASSIPKTGGGSVTVVSSGDATNNIWFAPSGTTVFSAGPTMTTALGTATSILAPATAGTYKMFVLSSGGTPSSASTATLTVDNTAPTIALTSAASSTVNASFTVTATFSEATTNFVLGDITITNGTASSFSGSGTTYTFTVNPTLNGLVSVDIGAGVATDAAGNGNIATTAAPTYALRSTGPGGGLVFYTTNGGLQGLEAATANQGSFIIWAVSYYQSTSIPGTSTAIGTGSANTDLIIAQNGAGTTYAAGLARAYTGGGKSDWFLPSKDEINLMYTQLKAFSVGSFTTNYYWSSSEATAASAWEHYFSSGSQSSYTKGGQHDVRAVRAFTSAPSTLTRTYVPPTITQSDYKLFSNLNSTNVGSVLTSQNTSYTLNNLEKTFRLRLLMGVDGFNLPSNGANFKLQYADKIGSCDTSFAGENYIDVTSNTEIAYNNNFDVRNGVSITGNINDPVHNANTVIPQTYVDSSIFTNTVSSIPVGQYGEWDFSLYTKDVSGNKTYCLRVIKEDGNLLDGYSFIPEITTAVYRHRGGGFVGNLESVGSGPGVGGGTKKDDDNPIDKTQCSDGIDNDGDTLIDAADPQCHLGGLIGNLYVPTHTSESVAPPNSSGGGGHDGDCGDLGSLHGTIQYLIFLHLKT